MPDYNYIESQLDVITKNKDDNEIIKVKFISKAGACNWLDITGKEFKQIKKVLIKTEKEKKPRYKKDEQNMILTMTGLSKYQAEVISRNIRNFSSQDLKALSRAIDIIKQGD